MSAQPSVAIGVPESTPGVLGVYRRLQPSEGWWTVALLLGSLYSVVWAVYAADWVTTPSLIGVVTVGVLAGMAACKVRRYPVGVHAAATVGGAALVYWQSASLAGGDGFVDSFLVFNERVLVWSNAATGQGISTDTIVFATAVTGFAWIVAYVSAWAIFGRRSMWGGILPGALAHLSNLSYLPDRFVPFLFLYLLFALLLAVQLHSLERVARWRLAGIRYPDSFAATVSYHGIWVVSLLLLFAWFVPLEPPAQSQLRRAWNDVRAPMEELELHVARLFSGIPARKATPFRTFGTYLPFQGAITLGDQPLFVVDAPAPAYWRAQAYSSYTSQGWIAGGGLDTRPSSQLDPLGLAESARATTSMEYTVTPLITTSGLPSAPLPLSAPEPFSVRVLPTRSYWMPLQPLPGSRLQLPQDLEEAHVILQRLKATGALERNPGEIVLRVLPVDVAVTHVVIDDPEDGDVQEVFEVAPTSPSGAAAAFDLAYRSGFGEFVGIQVVRRPPVPADVLGVAGSRRVAPGESYTFVSRRSFATPEELRDASTTYPGWVTDTYLQLPDTLPQRVRDLAETIVANAPTPYDKATAVEAYLKTLPYDLSIPAPAFDSDGVDHHLFVVKRGYSDYFGSSLAVLLRVVGVPARMVAGYAEGEREAQVGGFVVRDRDSHGWAEAYFPGYGWIEFEPTPGRTLPAREVGGDLDLSLLGLTGGTGGSDEFVEEDLLAGETTLFVLPTLGGLPRESVLVTIASVLLVVAAAAGGLMLLYRRVAVVSVATPESVFQRVLLLGRLAGNRHAAHETPAEFTARLGELAPDADEELRFLGDAYAKARYGNSAAPEMESPRLARSWRRARRHLLVRAVWRLLPLR